MRPNVLLDHLIGHVPARTGKVPPVKRYAISYTPSASVMLWLMEERSRRDSGHRQGNDVLLIGDPVASVQVAAGSAGGARSAYERAGVLFGELEHAGNEIEVIGDVLSAGGARVTRYVREQATESRLRQGDLDQYWILHFATHAIADDEINWLR